MLQDCALMFVSHIPWQNLQILFHAVADIRATLNEILILVLQVFKAMPSPSFKRSRCRRPVAWSRHWQHFHTIVDLRKWFHDDCHESQRTLLDLGRP